MIELRPNGMRPRSRPLIRLQQWNVLSPLPLTGRRRLSLGSFGRHNAQWSLVLTGPFPLKRVFTGVECPLSNQSAHSDLCLLPLKADVPSRARSGTSSRLFWQPAKARPRITIVECGCGHCDEKDHGLDIPPGVDTTDFRVTGAASRLNASFVTAALISAASPD